MADFIDKTTPPANLDSELDLALNPTSDTNFDVLAKQALRPEPKLTVHDLSEIPLDVRPTEIKPLPVSSGALKFPIVSVVKNIEKKEDGKKEYLVNPDLIHYVNSLKVQGKSVRWILHTLLAKPTEAEVRGTIKDYRGKGFLNNDEYEKMVALLGEDTTEAPELVREPPVEDKKPESSVDDDTPKIENYVIPKELILYIRSLNKLGVGPQMILDVLESEGLSKKEVLTTLSDGYLHLKILSEEQYKKALTILGESEESIVESINRKPEFFNVSARTKKEDVVVGAVPIQEVPKAPEETIDKESLSFFRDEYAKAQVNFRKKNGEYKLLKKIKEGLGFGETTSVRLKEKSPQELVLEEARQALDLALSEYLKMKKKRAQEVFDEFLDKEVKKPENVGKTEEEICQSLDGQIKELLLEQAEEEWDIVEKKIDELAPKGNEYIEKTKALAQKAGKWWSEKPLPVRLGALPILIGGVVAVAPVGGLVVGASVAGVRTARAVGGYFGARVAGGLYGKHADKINEESGQKYKTLYTDSMADENTTYEEAEKKYMDAREEESKRMKGQRAAKAMLMVGAGVGTGILSGLAEASMHSVISKTSGAIVGKIPDVQKAGGSAKFFDGIRPKPIASHESSLVNSDAPTLKSGVVASHEVIPTGIPEIARVEVGVSAKGFEQDILDMKGRLKVQYGSDLDKMPEQVRDFVKTPYRELSVKYGFFDPKTGQSGVSLSGGKLVMDENGFSYEHGTQKDVLFDAKSDTVQKFGEIDGNKMSAPKPVENIINTEQTVPAINLDEMAGKGSSPDYSEPRQYNVENSNPTNPVVIESTPDDVSKAPNTELPNQSSQHIPYEKSFVDVVYEGGDRVVKFGTETIAHEKAFGSGKILALDDKYQDGPQYKSVRGAFVTAFEKNTLADQIGDTPTAVPFEGGKIYIVQGLKNNPDGISVLLNGKEIARNVVNTVVSSGVKIDYVSGIPHHGGPLGWLLSDNVYERAFKTAEKIIKTLPISTASVK